MLEKCSPGVKNILRVVKQNKTQGDLDERQEQPVKYPAVSTLSMQCMASLTALSLPAMPIPVLSCHVFPQTSLSPFPNAEKQPAHSFLSREHLQF